MPLPSSHMYFQVSPMLRKEKNEITKPKEKEQWQKDPSIPCVGGFIASSVNMHTLKLWGTIEGVRNCRRAKVAHYEQRSALKGCSALRCPWLRENRRRGEGLQHHVTLPTVWHAHDVGLRLQGLTAAGFPPASFETSMFSNHLELV